MKIKKKKSSNITLSEKIADALTIKPRADIEDDQVFATKPQTVSRADFSSSDSEEEAAISDFRKRSVHLLSEISKKYEGEVCSRQDIEEGSDDSNGSDLDIPANGTTNTIDESSEESKDSKTKIFKKLTKVDDSDSPSEGEEISPKSKIKNKSKSLSDAKDASESEGESDEYDIVQFKKQLENDESSDNDQSDDDDEGSGGDDEEGYDISQMTESAQEEFKHVKKQNVSEESKKGACVRNQLLLWEGLLEMRIHLQRCMNTANQMPLPETYVDIKKNQEFIEECNTTKSNISNTLDKFLNLQNVLLKHFPETKSLPIDQKQTGKTTESAKVESDEEIPSDTDNEEIPSDTEDEDTVKEEKKPSKQPELKSNAKKRKLEDYEKALSTTHKVFKPFRDTTIQKWNDKTRLATANIKNNQVNSVLQQITYILADREKLMRRTQLKRSEYDIVGYKRDVNKPVPEDHNGEENMQMLDKKDNDEYITEIFDDSDFYHQLLRELIECKSADISDPVQLSRQWITLQQMRSKMKRKVDTKATKGRKIKYVVHNKLVNYLAPEKSETWSDENVKELYSSLFGKMFEQNNIGVNDGLSNVCK